MRLNVTAMIVFAIIIVTAKAESQFESVHRTVPPVDCPPWTTPKANGTGCQCGDKLSGIVKCNPDTLDVLILVCHCMTYSDKYNTTVVGYCYFNCDFIDGVYVRANEMCTDNNLKRTGQMCGKCLDGYSPPVYSYSSACVECKDCKYRWLKYIAVAFLPLTVVYIVVMAFKVRVTSGKMNAYVLISQLAAAPFLSRLFAVYHDTDNLFFNVFAFTFKVWNLDMFRGFYHPFCLRPNMPFLQTIALEYAVAIYPLVLIILTYVCVKLHDHHSIVVRLWSPFYWCFRHVRRQWDIQDSLIGAFATFLLLSYVKITNISLDLLTPVALYDVHGKKMPKMFLFYDGTYEYLGKEHLPYACLALFMCLVFNIFPLVLLCLYPCQCFQRCLNCCHCRCQPLHIFMDTFHGCYKLEPRDYRHFASFFLLFRIVNLAVFAMTTSPLYYPLTGIMFMTSAFLVSTTRPYKLEMWNKIDTALFLIMGMLYFGVPAFRLIALLDPTHVNRHWYDYGASFLFIPPVYGIGLAIYYLIPKRVRLKFKELVQRCRRRNVLEMEEPQPYRIEHAQ